MAKHDLTLKMHECFPGCEQELYAVCKSMQTRVVELLPQLQEEGFIQELLMVNDDLNNAFIRYERCVVAFVRRFRQRYCRSRKGWWETCAQVPG